MSLMLELPGRPYGLAVVGRTAYVTQLDGSSYTRVATDADPTIEGVVRTGSTPTGVAATPDRSLVLVASQGDGSVTLHDGVTGAVLTRLAMRGSPFRVAVSRNAARAFALSSVGDLLVIDLATRRAVLTATTGLTSTNGLVESIDGSTIYVSSTMGRIAAVDARTGAVARTYDVPGRLQDVVLSPDGLKLYAADESGAVVALTIATGVMRRLPTGDSFGLAVSADGSQLWVTQPRLGRILVLDRATLLPLRTISLTPGSMPRRIAFDASGAAVVSDERGFVLLFR
jgi:DNA-binding beta-propeller fold protein YncE